MVGKGTLAVSNYTFAKMIYPEGHDNWTTARQMHLDGYTCEGVVDTFAIAVTVNINHVKPRSGGFSIWPGAHKRAYEYFKTHSLVNGLDAFRNEQGEYYDLPTPVDVTGPPGHGDFLASFDVAQRRCKLWAGYSHGICESISAEG